MQLEDEWPESDSELVFHSAQAIPQQPPPPPSKVESLADPLNRPESMPNLTSQPSVIPLPPLPPLARILNDEQKIALAALIVLTFNELANRYARFEFIDISSKAQRRNSSTSNSPSTLRKKFARFRRKSQEQAPLLNQTNANTALSDEEGQGLLVSVASTATPQNDENRPPTPTNRRPSAGLMHSPTKNTLRRRSSAFSKDSSIEALPAPMPVTPAALLSDSGKGKGKAEYRPFSEEMSNPETIEDVLFFGRNIDGNVALCYAMKTFQAWSSAMTERLYAALEISPHGKKDYWIFLSSVQIQRC